MSLAGPLLIILAGQAILVVVWARWVRVPARWPRLRGRGVGRSVLRLRHGCHRNGDRNMQAVTRRYGPAPESFVVVPIVGAFFVDLMNMAVLTFFLFPGMVRGL